MLNYTYNPAAPKRPVNISANSDLIQTAKSVEINLSQVFEEALLATVKQRLEQIWLAENKEAIAAYNDHVEKHGVFAADKRRF